MAVHISQFYSCSEVSLACELYYICELGKYSKMNYNESVSIDGIILKEVLKKSPIWHYFRIAVLEGWLVDSGVPMEEITVTVQCPLKMDKQTVCNYHFVLNEVPFNREDADKRRVNFDYDIRTPLDSQISFEEMENEYWLWSMNGENNSHFLCNNKSLNHTRADQSWLSLIAMVAVHRLNEGYPTNLLLSINSQVILNNMAISYIMILTEETQCLTGWCHFNLDDSVSENTALQLGYTAWYTKGRDIGLLDRWYNGKEKLEYMDKLNIKKGDFVMLFEREKSTRQNFVKSIASCHLANIKELTSSEIVLELINTTKPYFQGKEDFEDHSTSIKHMYSGNPPYKNLSLTKMSLDLAETGVEYYLHNERFFIVPLDGTDDLRVTRVSDGVRKDTLILNQNDLIYWIMKDYNYDFDETRFLYKYFKDKEPAYTRYMRGEVLEPEYYFKVED